MFLAAPLVLTGCFAEPLEGIGSPGEEHRETTATSSTSSEPYSTTVEFASSSGAGDTASNTGGGITSEGDTSATGMVGGDSTSGSGDGAVASGSSETGELPMLCEELQASDSACMVCSAQACCDELVACVDDNNCWCWIDCLADKKLPGTCILLCGYPDDAYNALAMCLGDECGHVC